MIPELPGGQTKAVAPVKALRTVIAALGNDGGPPHSLVGRPGQELLHHASSVPGSLLVLGNSDQPDL